MNKKFFTLLVALLATVSMGVSARVTVGTAPTIANLKADSYYLLQVSGGDSYLSVNNGELITVGENSLTSYSALQNALWEVTTQPGADVNVVLYRFKNKATETYLAMDKKGTPPTNILGGEVSTFISHTGTKTNIAQYFYNYQDNSTAKVWGIASISGDIALREAATPGNVEIDPDFVTLQPLQVSGTLTLNANDINTYMGRNGLWNGSHFLAQPDSYIQLSMLPENTLANPMENKLQAQGVTYTDVEGVEDGDALIDVAEPITFKGNTLSYQDITEEWVALKDVTSGDYLVVDTAYIPGTEQFSTPKMKTVTDKWYGVTQTATVKTQKRLADSYLYQFTYNATDNTVNIASKAYRFKGLENTIANRGVDGGYLWSDASTEVYDDTTDPVTEGNVFVAGKRYDVLDKIPTTTSAPALSPVPTAEELAALAKWERENPYMNYFTYAELAFDGSQNAVVYTWGERALKIKLDASAWYVPTQLKTDVYILQVKGSRNATDIGKYVKMSLDGRLEYVVEPTRQNFQHMPSAQWVVEATNNKTAKITNREFAYEFAPIGTTYEVKRAGNVSTNEFFYLGRDTLQWTAVTAENKANQYLGYYNLGEDPYSLNRFTLEYLHELLMDQPVGTDADALKTLKVMKEGKASNYTLVKVGTTNRYGYGHNVTAFAEDEVAQLVRDVYRVAVYETLSLEATQYVAYDAYEKKYHLTEEPSEASEFLLKENNEVQGEGGDCYYTLLEAPMLEWFAIGIAADDAIPGTAVTAANLMLQGEYAMNLKPLAANQSYYVVAYDDVDKRYEVVATDYYGGAGPYYFGEHFTVNNYNKVTLSGLFYADSKVSVDNNTLVLTNGVLGDRYDEVANSAFKVNPGKSVLYRTLGIEGMEDEVIDETVDGYKIKIFRANATTPEYLYEDANSIYSDSEGEGKGPNKPSDDRLGIKDQVNFLGVEGKGDNISGRAAMIARYVRGTVMPQYLLMVNYQQIQGAEAIPCIACAALIAQGLPPIENCPHDIKAGEAVSTARVLVNLTDSIDAYTAVVDKNKFRWNNEPRLAFVDAIFRAKSRDEKKTFTETDAYMTLSGKDLEYQVKFPAVDEPKEGLHTEYLHAFRLIDDRYLKEVPASYNDFLIETSRNSVIAGMEDYWIKVQNGVPVLSPKTRFSEAIVSAAERWNLETTTDAATSNEGIDAGAVKVIAGTGSVTIKGAAGQQVTIANILGQTVYTGVVSADEVTIAAPAGVVVVSVAGEATKALVK